MSFNRALRTIEEFLQEHGNADMNIVQNIRRDIDDFPNREDVETSVVRIAKAAKLVIRGNRANIFSSFLMVLSGVALIQPFTGQIVVAVLGIASSIFLKLCGDGERVGNVVYRSMQSVLDKFADSDLQEKVAGTVNVYKTSFAFLCVRNTIDNEHIPAVMDNVPISEGVECLGILQHKINEYSKSNDQKKAVRAIEYTKMYVELSILRTALLKILHNLIKQAEHEAHTANRIQNVINTEYATNKGFLKFLITPDYSQIVFCVYMYLSTMPHVSDYLQYLGLHMVTFDQIGVFTFDTGNLHIGLTRCWWGFRNDGEMTSTDEQGQSEYGFYLETISKVDCVFYVRTSKAPHLYVYMRNSPSAQCYACKGKPGTAGEWKITKLKDGCCVFSTLKWPQWFLKGTEDRYMPHTDVGYTCDKTFYHLEGYKNDYSAFKLD